MDYLRELSSERFLPIVKVSFMQYFGQQGLVGWMNGYYDLSGFSIIVPRKDVEIIRGSSIISPFKISVGERELTVVVQKARFTSYVDESCELWVICADKYVSTRGNFNLLRMGRRHSKLSDHHPGKFVISTRESKIRRKSGIA